MLTDLFILITTAYFLLALVAGLTVLMFDLPQWLDRATAYGDGKLNWAERIMLLIYAPAAMLYTAYFDKWPGLKGIVAELWVGIVLGRQVTSKDVVRHDD
jgi:hypothetical protein